MPSISASTIKSERGWSLDLAQIADAVEELGIKQDVVISLNHRIRLAGRAGNHSYKPAEQCHVIKLNTMLHPTRANDTLWHELAHAMQAERHAKANNTPIEDFDRAYLNQNENYYENQYEIEARKIALNATMKLVRTK